MKRVAIVLVMVALFAPAPLRGQQPECFPHPEAPGIGLMVWSPEALLRVREPLGLTEAQARRLDELARELRPILREQEAAMVQARRQGTLLLLGDAPDLSEYAAKTREASHHWVEAKMAAAVAILIARAVLTPAQRERIGASGIGQRPGPDDAGREGATEFCESSPAAAPPGGGTHQEV